MTDPPDPIQRYAQLNRDDGMVLATMPPEEDGPATSRPSCLASRRGTGSRR